MTVDHVGYRPIELARVLTLARAVAAGVVPQGGTTLARLRAVERKTA